MTKQARVLFVAGESGVGKTSACLAFQIYGPLLFADIISEKAGPQYFGNTEECFARWSLWTPELERPDNRIMRTSPGRIPVSSCNLIMPQRLLSASPFLQDFAVAFFRLRTAKRPKINIFAVDSNSGLPSCLMKQIRWGLSLT